MEQRSMTALVSAFSRWYHAQYPGPKVFDDTKADLFLTTQERKAIAENMAKGISFFNPTFKGTKEEALRWIVDNQLSPSPLGRAAFAEWHLQNSAAQGVKQYVILAAGYDSFAYRQPVQAKDMQIIELDHPATVQDKTRRVEMMEIEIPTNVHCIATDFLEDAWPNHLKQQPFFDSEALSFCTLLGISYYLPKAQFTQMIQMLGKTLCAKSSIVFDYPDQDTYTERAGIRAQKQAILATGANEAMLASYSYSEMEKLLESHGFLMYEHLTPSEITKNWFSEYNQSHRAHIISAFDNVNYCLAVKK